MALLVLRERRIRLESFAAPNVRALARSNIRMALLVPRELGVRFESFAAPDVCALPRTNIRMPFLVCSQLIVHFERLFALLARLRVNVVAYEVKDASVCEVVMISKKFAASERPM
jgi:hypothetical protein